MYVPNCVVRLGTTSDRKSLGLDFLINDSRKWGILEVDGRTYQSGNAAQDHERQHGGMAYCSRDDVMQCQRTRRCGNPMPRYPQNEGTLSPIMTRAWRAIPDANKLSIGRWRLYRWVALQFNTEAGGISGEGCLLRRLSKSMMCG